MSRYHIRKEVTKHGRKLEKNWAVVDNVDDRVIVRYATEKEATDLLARYEAAIKEAGDEDS